MERLLIIGCGDIALRAAPLLQKRYQLYGLVRSAEKVAILREQAIVPLIGDLDRLTSLSRIGGLAHSVLHLAPPPTHGLHDSRTAHLLAALSQATILPHRIIYISTSGVYGDCQGDFVSEAWPVRPLTERAWRRLDAENQLRAWGKRHQVAVVILRVPGIYAADRLPIARLEQKLPALVANEDSYTNHIHADDLAWIIVAALRRGRPGRIYNVSDDSHLKMGQYFDLVADYLKLPRPPRVTRKQAEIQVSPLLFSFMNESRRLMNDRLTRELKVNLLYPTVHQGLIGTEKQLNHCSLS